MNFEGKNVLVTGGSRGIGKAICDDFTDKGANVLSLSSSDYDLSDEEQLRSLVKHIYTLDRIDVCVNNAGINRINLIEDVSEKDYDDILMVNVKAPYMISKAVSCLMKSNNYGKIINIASIFGHCTKEKRSCYTTSKYALVGMTKAFAVELAEHNILVNCVSPGFTATDLTQRILGDSGIKSVCSQVPIRRLCKPAEISKTVLFLSSDLNTYLTGQNIIVDGGFVNV